MIVHLVDGTYELFRPFYGLRRFNIGADRPYGAVGGVLQTVLMIENGDTCLGVATDPVLESFRNRLWAGYNAGDGIGFTSQDILDKLHLAQPASVTFLSGTSAVDTVLPYSLFRKHRPMMQA